MSNSIFRWKTLKTPLNNAAYLKDKNEPADLVLVLLSPSPTYTSLPKHNVCALA